MAEKPKPVSAAALRAAREVRAAAGQRSPLPDIDDGALFVDGEGFEGRFPGAKAELDRSLGGIDTVTFTIPDPYPALKFLNSGLFHRDSFTTVDTEPFMLGDLQVQPPTLKATYEQFAAWKLKQDTKSTVTADGVMTRAEIVDQICRRNGLEARFPPLLPSRPYAGDLGSKGAKDTSETGAIGPETPITDDDAPPVGTGVVGKGFKTIPKVPLTFREVYRLAKWAGFTPDEAEQMTAVSMRESTHQPWVVNPSSAAGLWQLLSSNYERYGYNEADIRDPANNAKAARRLYLERKAQTGNGFDPWGADAGFPNHLFHVKDEWITAAQKARTAEEGGDVDRDLNAGMNTTAPVVQGTQDNPAENALDLLLRIADEVKWRILLHGRLVHFTTDRFLLERPAAAVLRAGDRVIAKFKDLDLVTHRRIRAQKASFDLVWATTQQNRWALPPGAKVLLRGFGPGDEGSWLVSKVSGSLRHPLRTVELERPVRALPEPVFKGRTSETGAKTFSAGSGSVVFDPNRWNPDETLPDVQGAATGMAVLLSALKQQFDTEDYGLMVISGRYGREQSKVASGGFSNHSDPKGNTAIDISVMRKTNVEAFELRDALTTGKEQALTVPKQLRLVDQAWHFVIALSGGGAAWAEEMPGVPSYNGTRNDIIWRTVNYGGHWNHMHCSFAIPYASDPERMRTLIDRFFNARNTGGGKASGT